VSKASNIDRLRDQIKTLRGRAGELPEGGEREDLLRKAEQDEISLRLIEWIVAPGKIAPPEGLVPIKKHRLRRK
jgi:hypothetical protein